MTYTKGPWEWLYAETHHDGIGRVVTAQVVDVTTSQCVVEFSNTSHSEIIYEDDGDGAGSFFDAQARANARLISAAPDMYEAGLALLEADDAVKESAAREENPPELAQLLAAKADAKAVFRAALLKAKGQNA